MLINSEGNDGNLPDTIYILFRLSEHVLRQWISLIRTRYKNHRLRTVHILLMHNVCGWIPFLVSLSAISIVSDMPVREHYIQFHRRSYDRHHCSTIVTIIYCTSSLFRGNQGVKTHVVFSGTRSWYPQTYFMRALLIGLLTCFPLWSVWIGVTPLVYYITGDIELSEGTGPYTRRWNFSV